MKAKLKHDNLVENAAKIYLRRKKRLEHPDGEFSASGIWYPKKSEKKQCCTHVRAQSGSCPHSVSQHCRTATHVAKLCKVAKKDLLKVAKTLTEADLN